MADVAELHDLDPVSAEVNRLEAAGFAVYLVQKFLGPEEAARGALVVSNNDHLAILATLNSRLRPLLSSSVITSLPDEILFAHPCYNESDSDLGAIAASKEAADRLNFISPSADEIIFNGPSTQFIA